MNGLLPALVPITALALAVSLASPVVWLPILRRLGVVDVPTARSAHTIPTARGVGLGPASGVLAAALGAALIGLASAEVLSLLAVGLLAAGLGLWEDVRGVPVFARLMLQLALGAAAGAVLVVVTVLPTWSVPIVALGFAAYVNAANFMDGIDGISAMHGLLCGGYFAFVGGRTGLDTLAFGGLVLAASYLAFAPWNLGRSRVFLGDCGSYLLGAVVLLLGTVALLHGVPILVSVAPLLPYLSDTGWTLFRRALLREPLLQSHRSHVYQRLVQQGFRHLSVTAATATATGGCAVLAWAYRGGIEAWVGCILVLGVYLASPAMLGRLRSEVVT